jgi:hypothetical protein
MINTVICKGEFVYPTPEHGTLFNAEYYDFNNKFGASFRIKAKIYNKNYRYRQYVRGFFKINGELQNHKLKNGWLANNDFLEDIQDFNEYGDRLNQIQGLSEYKKNFDCEVFEASDSPGQIVEPSHNNVEIELIFKGEIVSETNSSDIADSRCWRVFGYFAKWQKGGANGNIVRKNFLNR